MALFHSPSVVTNGLVFAYDQNSIRSYKGPAMQNLANGISIIGTGTTTGYSSTALTETVDIPGVGPSTVYTNIIQNNYTSYTPNSNNCCPSLHGWGSIAVSPSTLYTYMILYRCESGYTNPNYMYRYEYTSNGGAYVTEAGVHNSTNRVHLGGEWYYAWNTFTTQPTTNWLGHCGTFYYRYFNLPDRLSVAKTMIVAGNYSGLHPKYWPNQATTRSNTQAIVDLTGNYTINATNLSYEATGDFFFDNTNDFLDATPFTATTLTNATIEAWVYDSSADTNYRAIVQNNVAGDDALYVNPGNQLQWWPSTSSTLTVPRNSWTYVAASHTYGSGILYQVNNDQQSVSGTFEDPTDWDFMRIGGHSGSDSERWGGKIAVVRVYNRALSANELRQNFNAQRGRYGV